MSVFIDRNFLLQSSPKLQRFSRKKEDLYNFRCPYCGDSEKNKAKARGYIYRKANDYFYMCHNCNVSTTFYNFLKHVNPNILKEYILERYKNGETGHNNYPKPEFDEFKPEVPEVKIPVISPTLNLPSIESLSDEHFAKQYILNRKIPIKFHSQLYFCADFESFVKSFGIDKDLKPNDQRLIIPFYSKDNILIGFQGRALGESKVRYITIRIKEDADMIYGLNMVDETKKIYVVEGPFDSMFLDNAVATCNSNLKGITKALDKSNVVLVFDNEPRNKDIVANMTEAIDLHFNICIWPDIIIDKKDINDMVLDGFSPEEIQDFIDEGTFNNLRAKMEFMNWKKI